MNLHAERVQNEWAGKRHTQEKEREPQTPKTAAAAASQYFIEMTCGVVIL